MYLAKITPGSYLDFGDPVPFRDSSGVLERGLLNDAGRLSGRAQAAVRPVSPEDFARIAERGLGRDEDILPRDKAVDLVPGLSEPLVSFEPLMDGARVVQMTRRTVRDRNFRKTVLRAYGERCAITGLRLINGGGRAEVEAAHIRPVADGGPDIIGNGIALSGTAHWMFDRGLVGLSDDLRVLVSRQVNDVSAVRSMINETGYLLPPLRSSDQPHPTFVRWHRETSFKH